jgi:hypothetical protein
MLVLQIGGEESWEIIQLIATVLKKQKTISHFWMFAKNLT